MVDVSIEARIEVRSAPSDQLGSTVAVEEISRWLAEHNIKHVVDWPTIRVDMVRVVVIRLSAVDAPSVRGWLVSKGCPHNLQLREEA